MLILRKGKEMDELSDAISAQKTTCFRTILHGTMIYVLLGLPFH
jgi:hypothetical protein